MSQEPRDEWWRDVRAQLVAESGARYELVHATGDFLARFVGYPPRGAARYVTALRADTTPSVVYIVAEHILSHPAEYDVCCRQLPGLASDVVLLRGNNRVLSALHALASLPREPQPCTCWRHSAGWTHTSAPAA